MWAAVALLAAGTVWDLKHRTIPDVIPAAILAVAVATTAWQRAPQGWWMFGLGFAVALALGLALFARGGLGGGDVKVLAALGALVGLRGLFPLLFYVAIAGGVLGIVALARGKRDVAYAPAIALGFLVFVMTRAWR